VSIAKIIELVGNSDVGWEEAVANAVAEASQTLEGITGVEVTNMTATVENGQLATYKATVKVAFRLRNS
jgi:flavin-binding protein dodecin